MEVSFHIAERCKEGYHQMGTTCYGDRDSTYDYLGGSEGVRGSRSPLWLARDTWTMTQVPTECDGEIVVRIAYRCVEGNERMRRRCLDYLIQMFCILAFQISTILAFKTGVNFIL